MDVHYTSLSCWNSEILLLPTSSFRCIQTVRASGCVRTVTCVAVRVDSFTSPRTKSAIHMIRGLQ